MKTVFLIASLYQECVPNTPGGGGGAADAKAPNRVCGRFIDSESGTGQHNGKYSKLSLELMYPITCCI